MRLLFSTPLVIIFISLIITLLVGFLEIKVSSPTTSVQEKPLIEINPSETNINAKGFIIYDVDTGNVVAEKNSEITYPVASITKVISALVIAEHLDDQDISVISKADFKLYGNTDIKLKGIWNAKELVKFSLIESSNRGLNAVARTVEEKVGKTFEELLFEYSERNGLTQSYFINATGLDVHETLASSKSSARDIAKIFTLALENIPDIIHATTRKTKTFVTENGERYIAENTNKLVKEDNMFLASKTGYTNLANGNLAVAINVGENHRVIIVVLSSTLKGRFSDMKKLIKVADKFYNES